MRNHHQSNRHAQRGAVLIVSLILLLVMTILALSGSQMARLQERMSGNIRDADVAFQSAEAGARDSEEYLQAMTAWPSICTALGSTCRIYDTGVLANDDLRYTDSTFWSTYGWEYRTSGTKDITEAQQDPRYIIEKLATICDTAESPCTEYDSLYYFRTTARSVGGTVNADARVETTFVRRAP